jgi:catechol 2,3-dioxygenase-like lactoylglutathione lyase family enzyme
MRIDFEKLANDPTLQRVKNSVPPTNLPFSINKIGHVVVHVEDIERSVAFYTQVLGFEVSDAYPGTMMPGGMVFLRFNPDHHGIALIGGATGPASNSEFHHMAFEVSTLAEVVSARDHLRTLGVPIDFEGRRRAGCQIAVEFRDPDNHRLEIYWGLDQVEHGQASRVPEQWREHFSIDDAIADPPPGQDTSLLPRA